MEVDLDPIRHAQASLVVVNSSGSENSYAPADLEVLTTTYRMVTATPWRDEPTQFEGILLSDLLEANNLQNEDSIAVVAENDYRTVIQRETWESVSILIATRVDGQPHNRRERGPIQFVIDQGEFESSAVATESDLVWMAARIEPNR